MLIWEIQRGKNTYWRKILLIRIYICSHDSLPKTGTDSKESMCHSVLTRIWLQWQPCIVTVSCWKKKRKFWPKIKKKRIWRQFEAMHRQPRPCTEVTQWGKLLTRKTVQSSQSVKPHLWINFILMGCVWLSICLVTKVIFNERNGKTGHRAGHSIVLRLYELKWFRPLLYTTIRQSFPQISYGTGCFFFHWENQARLGVSRTS